jgi:hypothetical protein
MMSQIVRHEVVVGGDEPAQGAHGGAVAVELVDRQAIGRLCAAKVREVRLHSGLQSGTP